MRYLGAALAAACFCAPAGAAVVTKTYEVTGRSIPVSFYQFGYAGPVTLKQVTLTAHTTGKLFIGQYSNNPIGDLVAGQDYTFDLDLDIPSYRGLFYADLHAEQPTDNPRAWVPGSATFHTVTLDLGTDFTPIPEPSSWALMLSGFGLVGLVRRKRRPSTFAT